MTIPPASTRAMLTSAILASVLLVVGASSLRGQTPAYVNFEARQSRPISLSSDGRRLFAVNTPDARLSVFDVSNSSNPSPVLIREIQVGLEPVSVNVVSGDEAWVVNQVSDSVSVVSVATGMVTDTLACKDEPSDVVFAGGRAFISCSGSNLVRVFSLATHAELAPIQLQGLCPRSLSVSNDGTKVYVAFSLSGNRTTLLPANLAPPQPAPTNTSLPPPPRVALIVSADDSRLSPKPSMPDNDVAEIDVPTGTVARYFRAAGTVNFCIATRPGSSELWLTNTEARNLVRFEPVLRGHVVDNRVTRISTAGAGTVTPFDLNPGVDYTMFPNDAAKVIALAQPMGIAFEPDGAHFWIASFGTDRVARVDASTGAVVTRVETGPTTGVASNPRAKRGPRGLAFQHSTSRLFVLNRISNTISVVSTLSGQVWAEVPAGSYDPTPAVIREGRGFLYDARLSGNGTQSCASCHIDGDRDELAWDLGDPGGSMQAVTQPNPLGGPDQVFNMHPMKGPMTTQTLRGIAGTEPLHWRGDRASFLDFNGAFVSLLGGSMLPAADMELYRSFIHTVVMEPNPNQNLDRTLPASFPPGDPNAGDPNAGKNTYINEFYQPGLTCNTCHALPAGTNGVIIPAAALQESQAFKIPQLRNVFQKRFFARSATVVSLSGFGIAHDGTDSDLFTFLSRPVFGAFAGDTTRKRNLSAFVHCMDTGTAPAVGHARTATSATLSAVSTDWATLESQASAGNIDLILRGRFEGALHGFRFRPATNDYVSDQTGLGPFTKAQLTSLIGAGSTSLTLTGVPAGSGDRMGIDRDGDSVLDADEPMPPLELSLPASLPRLAWPASHPFLVLEFVDSLDSPDWQPVTEARRAAGPKLEVDDTSAGFRRFYRLRKP